MGGTKRSLGQRQLDDVLFGEEIGCSQSGAGAACKKSTALFDLNVPRHNGHFGFGKSSHGKNVAIPDWVELGGVRYRKLSQFPNTELSTHTGAHGCVAAYERVQLCPKQEREAEVRLGGATVYCKLPSRIALKCVPFSGKDGSDSSPWANEWRIHNFLRGLFETDPELAQGTAQCLGGVLASAPQRRHVFFALELLDTDLFTMIELSSGRNDFGLWILRALLNVSSALDRLHHIGIVYCDLKPENVLVDVATATCKFGDFDRSVVPGLQLCTVGGTKGYYSPERMSNSSLHTIADDTWAFGVLMLIAATTAASPYLDLSLENLHKFVPSHYLARYGRCWWPASVATRIGKLCDDILQVKASERCLLRHVSAELSAAVDEFEHESAFIDSMTVEPCVSQTSQEQHEVYNSSNSDSAADELLVVVDFADAMDSADEVDSANEVEERQQSKQVMHGATAALAAAACARNEVEQKRRAAVPIAEEENIRTVKRYKKTTNELTPINTAYQDLKLSSTGTLSISGSTSPRSQHTTHNSSSYSCSSSRCRESGSVSSSSILSSSLSTSAAASRLSSFCSSMSLPSSISTGVNNSTHNLFENPGYGSVQHLPSSLGNAHMSNLTNSAMPNLQHVSSLLTPLSPMSSTAGFSDSFASPAGSKACTQPFGAAAQAASPSEMSCATDVLPLPSGTLFHCQQTPEIAATTTAHITELKRQHLGGKMLCWEQGPRPVL